MLSSKYWKTLKSSDRNTFLLRKISPPEFEDDYEINYIYFVIPIFRNILLLSHTSKDYDICGTVGHINWYHNYIVHLNEPDEKCYYRISNKEIHFALTLKQEGVYNLCNMKENEILSSFEYKRSNFEKERLVLMGGVRSAEVQRIRKGGKEVIEEERIHGIRINEGRTNGDVVKRGIETAVLIDTVAKIDLPGGRDINGLYEWREQNCIIVFSVHQSDNTIFTIRLTDPNNYKFVPKILLQHKCSKPCYDFDKMIFIPKQHLLIVDCGSGRILADFTQHPNCTIRSKISESLGNYKTTLHDYIHENDLLVTSSEEKPYFETWKYDPSNFEFIVHKRIPKKGTNQFCVYNKFEQGPPLQILCLAPNCYFVIEEDDYPQKDFDELLMVDFEGNELMDPIPFNDREDEKWNDNSILMKMGWFWKEEEEDNNKKGIVVLSKKDVFVFLIEDLRIKTLSPREEKEFIENDLRDRVQFLNNPEENYYEFQVLQKKIVLLGGDSVITIRVEWSFLDVF